ncbi:hypothetical protein HY745_14435 [Candidatus Desantisbacteria bacterium]|nr:hypothetical protein [Candidatus Desantisbacteria bacterium]
MKKMNIYLFIMLIIISFSFCGCEVDKLREENTNLKQQIETLTSEKATMDSQIKELSTKVEDLTKNSGILERTNENLRVQVNELSKKKISKNTIKAAPKAPGNKKKKKK